MIYNNVIETIGNTPVVKLNRLFGDKHNIYIKLEKINPGGSLKDRIALEMIEDAERKHILTSESIIVEPTSGNTGIGLALVGAVKGYKVVLVMPESMSVERRKLMKVYGATFVLSPKEKGMKGAIEMAQQMAENNPNVWIPQQFENPANIQAHKKTTALEILSDFPKGLDYLITGVGTGGHITGCATILKEAWENLKVFAVEPTDSAVISGGTAGAHAIQGIGTGFIPANFHQEVIDEAISVTKEEAFEYARKIAQEEGIFVGISTGASLAAIAKRISTLPEGASILTFNYDTGERYLSVEDLY